MPIYCKLFNLILNTSKIPNSWSEGIILPIYTNKGSVSEPTSYRPITLVSCLGKTFTAILNNRLSQLSDEIELITEAQTGFKKGYGTTDNIFTLYALFSIYQSLGKNCIVPSSISPSHLTLFPELLCGSSYKMLILMENFLKSYIISMIM